MDGLPEPVHHLRQGIDGDAVGVSDAHRFTVTMGHVDQQPDLAAKLSEACAVLKQELLDPSSVSSLTGRLKRRVVLD